MTDIRLYHPTGILNGIVRLPASKSLSNRALIINALSGSRCSINNLSDARDTVIMKHLLYSKDNELNAQDAGTAFRFLTAYLSLQSEDKILTGSERMRERPIGALVNALSQIGVEIEYLDKPGFPPICIKGLKRQMTDIVKVDAGISSQFISALMMIAPALPQGLKIQLDSHVVSRPYILMTASLMKHFGAELYIVQNIIEIKSTPYKATTYHVESDWSAASYFYSCMAMARGGELILEGLYEDSLQGDRVVADIYKNYFGIESIFTPDGLVLKKSRPYYSEEQISFLDCPDLAQTFLVTAAAAKRIVTINGLSTLKIKETDRVHAMQTELSKVNVSLTENQNEHYNLNGSNFGIVPNTYFDTYEDHRMAMAFAPLAMIQPVCVCDSQVIVKSFPGYWQELKNLGFEIENISLTQ